MGSSGEPREAHCPGPMPGELNILEYLPSRCGSYAKRTTCRIEYLEGEPEKMTRAELEVLESRDLLGQVRLSCQALCDHDMSVRVLMTVSSTGLDGPGPHPEPQITPEPEWVDKPA
jgi:ferredoxin